MSLLESPSLIEVHLFYKFVQKDNSRKLVIIDDAKAEGMTEEERIEKEIETLSTKWAPLSWKEQNDVMTLASKSVSQAGEREFNFLLYRDGIIKRCLKEWNIEVDNNAVPVSAQAIDQLPAAIIGKLYDKFEKVMDYTEDELKN